jgi:hypothetical protein
MGSVQVLSPPVQAVSMLLSGGLRMILNNVVGVLLIRNVIPCQTSMASVENLIY